MRLGDRNNLAAANSHRPHRVQARLRVHDVSVGYHEVVALVCRAGSPLRGVSYHQQSQHAQPSYPNLSQRNPFERHAHVPRFDGGSLLLASGKGKPRIFWGEKIRGWGLQLEGGRRKLVKLS